MPPDEMIFMLVFSIAHAFVTEKARTMLRRENEQSDEFAVREHPTRAVVERTAV